MTQTTTENPAAYAEALRQGAAVWTPPDARVLRLLDADRVDFLQRMTTNDIKALRPGASCVTVLTSPTARIVHVFTVLADVEELWLLPAPGESAALERHLRGQIFFMDKVRVARPQAELIRLRIAGPRAETALAGAGFTALPSIEGGWQRADDLVMLKQTVYDLPGYELIAPADRVTALLAQLDAVAVDAASYTARRIELGRPAPGAELTGEYSPLEAGLAWACAENKGCYTGQEIIARQITYDKVTRALVGLRSNAMLAPGAAVLVEEREVGKVTSAAFSPTLQTPVALAILKRGHYAPGTAATVEGVAATVAPLPLV
ncbi:glycine cleavage T C-terminal barrel domain-containing protein [Caldilinea sp.]|uniref:CAF17-like 4Fe-4S cluster assembly/insertion protein YgfZ n=1 Tax=Caldilinea sp. TaxID=2293560 RepID=UPI002C8BB6F2|nr:glycine cleavage T C-terminal barrel domain-containing protein [Caldilinea sp.]